MYWDIIKNLPYHNWIDYWKTEEIENIFCSYWWIVEKIENKKTWYWNCIKIRSNEFLFIYGHLNEIFVKEWEMVKMGANLWTMWMSWNSTWVHLHFEVRKNNKYINPTKFMFNEEILKEVSKDYNSMSIEEMKKLSIEWSAEKQFNEWLKVLKAPKIYKDFKNCIINWRILLWDFSNEEKSPAWKLSPVETAKSVRDATVVWVWAIMPQILEMLELIDLWDNKAMIIWACALIAPFINRLGNFFRI